MGNRHHYVRHCLLDVGTVLKALLAGDKVIVVPGIGEVGISSNRMLTYTKGIKCAHCKRETSYFAVERHMHEPVGWHLNPYHKTKKGLEVMMTSDHIIAKANNGGNELANRQCMCQQCNNAKGRYDSVLDAEINKEVIRATDEWANLMEKIPRLKRSIKHVSSNLTKGIGDRPTIENWGHIHELQVLKLQQCEERLKEIEESKPTSDLAFEFDPMFIPRLLIHSLGSTLVLL